MRLTAAKLLQTFAAICCFTFSTFISTAQSTYTLGNYAASGDTFYITGAQLSNTNFDTTGANITWDYSSLTGSSQKRLIYRLPSQTGFTTFQWPYINNTNNVNLSSTDGQTIAIGGIQQTDPNDYYLKNNNLLREKASSYKIVINNSSITVKNVYDNPDTIYHFPITYQQTSGSHAAYAINVPNLYHRTVFLNRKDTVNGYGSLITPYSSFSNCLRLVSTVQQIDSISVNDSTSTGYDTTYYREIKWLDPAKKYPLLFVRQNLIGSNYITQTADYLDVQQFYQPKALFAFYPVLPNMGDTVSFQNLSTNGSSYKWNFSDSISGAADSSTDINPQHIFINPGTYAVRLIAFNGPLSDTSIINITVNPKNLTYTFNGNGNWSDATNWSNGMVPPSPLPATNSIVIDPANGGICMLDVVQHISSGASLTVANGKALVVPGLLKVSN